MGHPLLAFASEVDESCPWVDTLLRRRKLLEYDNGDRLTSRAIARREIIAKSSTQSIMR